MNALVIVDRKIYNENESNFEEMTFDVQETFPQSMTAYDCMYCGQQLQKHS